MKCQNCKYMIKPTQIGNVEYPGTCKVIFYLEKNQTKKEKHKINKTAYCRWNEHKCLIKEAIYQYYLNWSNHS